MLNRLNIIYAMRNETYTQTKPNQKFTQNDMGAIFISHYYHYAMLRLKKSGTFFSKKLFTHQFSCTISSEI